MSSRLFDRSLVIGLFLAVFVASTHVTQIYATPTVHAVEHLDLAADAEHLADLLMSGPIEYKEINKFLVKRTGTQRESIIYTINKLYGNTILLTVLMKFVQGDYGKAMTMVLSRPLFIYTEQLRYAIATSDEETILEIIFTTKGDLLDSILKDYQSRYGTDVVDDVKKIASSPVFPDLVRYVIQNNPEPRDMRTPEQIKEAARHLVELIERSAQPDAISVAADFLTLEDPSFQQVVIQYYILTGHTIVKALSEKFDSSVMGYLETIGKLQVARSDYFADKLHKAIHNVGKPILNDINRIIITRSEIDLKDIQNAYERDYKTKLSRDISSLPDVAHKKLLLAFLGTF